MNLPPFNTDYTEININNISFLANKPNDFITECMKLTVGKNGGNFKKITEKYSISFIYHNIDKQTISIWGSKNKFNLVKKDIMNYLNWSYNYLETRKTI